MCFSWTSGNARGLGLLFMVCACVVGLRENRLTWMRGTWGLFWRSAHGPTIPFTWLRRAKAWGRTAHASHHHATRGLPINVYVLYPMLPICALIGRERSREQFDDVCYANESCDPFLALWLAKSNICCALIGYRLCRPCLLLCWIDNKPFVQLPPCLCSNWLGLRLFSSTAFTWVWYTTFSNVLAITDVTLMPR